MGDLSACGHAQAGMKRVYELDVYKLTETLFLVPMLQRGNAYHIGSHAGAWEPGIKRKVKDFDEDLSRFQRDQQSFLIVTFWINKE